MRITILDTETTGLKNSLSMPVERRSKITELCMLTYNTKLENLVGEFDQIFNVPDPLEPIITKITGFTDADLADKPTMDNFIPEIRRIIESSDLVVAHNVAYDVGMLDCEFDRFGAEPIFWPRKFCTVQESEHIKGHRLKLMQLHEILLGEPFKEAHRARPDTEAVARCYFKLIEGDGQVV